MKRAWAPSEDAILRAAIASRIDSVDTHAELARWGYNRSLEAVAQRMKAVRAQIYREENSADPEMLRASISRRWL